MVTRKICFVINHAAFFVSHRMPIALSAQKLGYGVTLITGQAGSESMESIAELALARNDLRHDRVCFKSASINPVLEIFGLFQLVLKLKILQPDIVHCASPKGVLYGGIACRVAGVPALVLAISGMGYAFTSIESINIKRRLIGFIYKLLARFAFRHKNIKVIVQNNDDLQMLLETGWVKKERIVLIPGSGVELSEFTVLPMSDRDDIVLFPARVLYDKGVLEFVKAATIIASKCPGWKFVIAGAVDYDNPSAPSQSMLDSWNQLSFIKLLGHVDDMPAMFMRSKIVSLPSYREGMPKALLEASAAGCAIVTSDVTGCREAIEDGVTGDLVPVSDANSLAEAIYRLIQDDERCERYGIQGRKRAEKHFSVESVISNTLNIYEDLTQNASTK
jgi:glycosyltransferase involved in cell wall biosynthesis